MDRDDEGNDQAVWKFSDRLHCADCDISYAQPLPSTFSFNSPLGACETCRGFGRVIGIDYGLVIPDENRTLEDGAIIRVKPTIIGAVRVEGQYDPDGNPFYALKGGPNAMVIVQAPEHLKKPAGAGSQGKAN